MKFFNAEMIFWTKQIWFGHCSLSVDCLGKQTLHQSSYFHMGGGGLILAMVEAGRA
jgi:hypothetical protein